MSSTPICIPSVLGPMIICLLFPPLFVTIHEICKDTQHQNFYNIIRSIILTCCFYFPGLIYSLGLIRREGSWNDNYSGL